MEPVSAIIFIVFIYLIMFGTPVFLFAFYERVDFAEDGRFEYCVNEDLTKFGVVFLFLLTLPFQLLRYLIKILGFIIFRMFFKRERI